MDSDEDLLQMRNAFIGSRSCISEVSTVQRGVENFTNCLEAFGRFVPLPLVRSIAQGSERRMRLSVSRQDVSIMFLSVRDFASICEALPQSDILLIVMMYQSVMVQIVELYQGTVTEILDDGLLAFWNAPDSVADHAAKACLAALAQMQAAAQLNAQLERLGLPRLDFSIGIHTGQVLSGTVGSDSRMKFGCMGDSVNLTSRLMGLCRYFGVGTVCSAETRQALAPNVGLLLRKLGEVRVKGRKEPTTVFELFGQEDAAPACAQQCPEAAVAGPPIGAPVDLEAGSEGPGALLARRRDGAWRYEQALDAFLGRRFAEAQELVSALLEVNPDDVAAAKLLGRIRECLCEVGSKDAQEAELVGWTGVLQMQDK
uniref:Guanylate cyclase domain-containing protein n=1 Tax=Alexandrium andersonii TaxID=327968 RepID=A0A7S2BW02_9DINO